MRKFHGGNKTLTVLKFQRFFSNNENSFSFNFINNNPTLHWKCKSIILFENEVNVVYGQTWLTLKALCGG